MDRLPQVYEQRTFIFLPPMFFERDKVLIVAFASCDPLVLRPDWSERGLNMVPHLTEPTRAEGFEFQLSILWLWHRFVAMRPEHSPKFGAFYLIFRKTFKNTATRINSERPKVAGFWSIDPRKFEKQKGDIR